MSLRSASFCLIALSCASLARADEAPKGPPGPPAPPMKTVTFLGTSTDFAPAVVSSQLGLPEGEGLVVQGVADKSPASGSLQVNDVLTKLDDQLLINPPQLAVLVRAHAAGDSVTIAYIRQGKPGTTTIRLASHEAPDFGGLPRGPRFGGFFHDAQGGPSLRVAPNSVGDDDLLAPPGPGTPGQFMRIERHGDGDDMVGTAVHAVRWDTTNGHLTYTDEDITYDLDIKEGKKTLKITDAKGKSLFSGPIDTPEQRAKIPDALKPKLDSLERSMHHVRTQGTMPMPEALGAPGGPPSGAPGA